MLPARNLCRCAAALVATASLTAGCVIHEEPPAYANAAYAPQQTAPVTQSGYAPGPAEAYELYLSTLARAQTVDEILPYLSAETRARVASVPAEGRANELATLKTQEPANVQIERADANGTQAQLEVHGDPRTLAAPGSARARVTMVFEDGLWRVDREDWSVPTPSPPPAPAPLPAPPP